METLKVRQHYERYAQLERTHHANAHPTYKFSPRRTSQALRKRKTISLRERWRESSRDPQWVVKDKEHAPVPTSVDCDTTTSRPRLSDCKVMMSMDWSSQQWETSMVLPQAQHQQCHPSEGDSPASSLGDVLPTQSHDPLLAYDAQKDIDDGSTGLHQCMCFSCMCCAHSTVLYNGVYNTYDYGAATALQTSHAALPICSYSILFSDT
jgi:hypothetical protein